MIKQLPVATDVREGIFWCNAVKLFNLPVGSGECWPDIGLS
jgi:hypothetical protein